MRKTLVVHDLCLSPIQIVTLLFLVFHSSVGSSSAWLLYSRTLKTYPRSRVLPPRMTSTDDDKPINNAMVRIRDCDLQNNSDRTSLLSLVRELQAHEVAVYDRMKRPEDLGDDYLAYLQDECHEHAGHILFAVNDETTCVQGYAVVLTHMTSADQIEEVDYKYGSVTELAVTATSRGQVIGQQLLQECEQRVQKAGVSYMRTEVLASNPGAHRVYHKFGFPRSFDHDGEEVMKA
ncbi:expressed unknown protein [Seminavis robusta]|uniref:N-acetyltransferase domain-containing protein n=1 Tax=Seminavis robusta TaxID=568900 RepID=A0A9N8HZD2_9STRA|nr:expressed unknown protein [Seminavis robusta]|eukprot:Sro2241_g320350.1 n/a (234) ;mRNA; r:5361-6062